MVDRINEKWMKKRKEKENKGRWGRNDRREETNKRIEKGDRERKIWEIDEAANKELENKKK